MVGDECMERRFNSDEERIDCLLKSCRNFAETVQLLQEAYEKEKEENKELRAEKKVLLARIAELEEEENITHESI